jgi:hypothetical protein
MNHLRTLAGVLAAAAIAVPGAAASPRLDGPLALHFTSVQKSFTASPPITKSSPPKIGSRMIFDMVMYNRGAQLGKPSGARVGTAHNVCTIVSRSSFRCALVAHLPNGDVRLAGSIQNGAKVSHFAVTGGAGAYADSRGEATGKDVSDRKTLVDLQLR